MKVLKKNTVILHVFGLLISSCRNPKTIQNNFHQNGQLLNDKNFCYLDAPKSQWEQSYIRRSLFKNAHLEKANFKNCFAFRASFQKANLKDANFSNCDLKFADFREADLRGADFTNALLYDARFDGALIDKTTKITFSEGKKSSILVKD